MAEQPALEPLSTALILRDLKSAIVTVTREREELRALLESVKAVQTQNQSYEREIESARGQVFVMLAEQIQQREQAHADEYVAVVENALVPLQPPPPSAPPASAAKKESA